MPVEGAQTPELQSPHPPRPPQVAKRWTHLLARAWWCLVLCTTIFEQRSRLLPKGGHERRHANQHPYVKHTNTNILWWVPSFFEQIPTFQIAGTSYHWMKDDESFIHSQSQCCLDLGMFIWYMLQVWWWKQPFIKQSKSCRSSTIIFSKIFGDVSMP